MTHLAFCHHDIQDQITSDEVRDAEHFAILMDESKDISKKEQISVTVCYLRPESGEVWQDF